MRTEVPATVVVTCDRCHDRLDAHLRGARLVVQETDFAGATSDLGGFTYALDLCPKCRDAFNAWRKPIE